MGWLLLPYGGITALQGDWIHCLMLRSSFSISTSCRFSIWDRTLRPLYVDMAAVTGKGRPMSATSGE